MIPNAEQTWRRYAELSVVQRRDDPRSTPLFRLQGHLPLNPDRIGAVNKYVSFNTASSFITNTNWQAYGGETTMTYLSQMFALTFQNFLSAAVGMAVLVALIRGLIRAKTGRGRQLLGRHRAGRPLHPDAAVRRSSRSS